MLISEKSKERLWRFLACALLSIKISKVSTINNFYQGKMSIVRTKTYGYKSRWFEQHITFIDENDNSYLININIT